MSSTLRQLSHALRTFDAGRLLRALKPSSTGGCHLAGPDPLLSFETQMSQLESRRPGPVPWGSAASQRCTVADLRFPESSTGQESQSVSV
jgi:hypothetical protein